MDLQISATAAFRLCSVLQDYILQQEAWLTFLERREVHEALKAAAQWAPTPQTCARWRVDLDRDRRRVAAHLAQVKAILQREGARFPPGGLGCKKTFFAEKSTDAPSSPSSPSPRVSRIGRPPGRPKSDAPPTGFLGTKVEPQVHDAIIAMAMARGVTVSAIVREFVLQGVRGAQPGRVS